MNAEGAAKPVSQGQSVGALLLGFLGSMNLAITLLVAVGIASIVGTVLKQNEAFQNYIVKFGPFWFEVFDTLGLRCLQRAVVPAYPYLPGHFHQYLHLP